MRSLISSVAVFLLLGIPLPASAEVQLCLEVQAEPEELENLSKLLRTELARHPSHRLVERDCQVHLTVELFEVAKAKVLTLRIDDNVPMRLHIDKPGDLIKDLADGLSLVLDNDPVRLNRDIAHMSLLERAAHSVLQRGNTNWRFELFQAVGRSDSGAAFAPGGAFAMSRGANHAQVMARVYAAGFPGGLQGDDRVLRVMAGADVGAAWEFDARSAFSFYLGAGIGLRYVRYEGLLRPTDPGSDESFNAVLGGITLRAGLRMFRTSDFDLDLYAAAFIPLHPAVDVDSLLFGEDGLYTPSGQVGIGVGF